MNCKKVEELLPLYAGRDLDAKSATLVDAHLQTCTACAKAANEYNEAFQLTRQFAPPVFSEGVYAGMRQRVLRELETEPAGTLLPHAIANWFAPRLTWAFASAVVIVLALFSFYLLAIRRTNNQPTPSKSEVVRHTETNQLPPDRTEAPSPLPEKEKPSLDQPTPRKRDQRSTIVAKNGAAGTAKSVRRGAPEINHQPSITDASPDGKTLRVEMQTQDPNIRIIWFTQLQTKTSSSKGT